MTEKAQASENLRSVKERSEKASRTIHLSADCKIRTWCQLFNRELSFNFDLKFGRISKSSADRVIAKSRGIG